MKRGLLTFTLLMVPFVGSAQSATGVDELRSQLQTSPAAPQPQSTTINVRTVSAPTAVVAAPDYQTQPTTLVEDAPYADSKSSAIRKRRQSVEDQTENKIVEKLETERMKDEERRARKILTNMETPDPDAAPVAVVVPAQQVPAQQVAPQPVGAAPIVAPPVQQQIQAPAAAVVVAPVAPAPTPVVVAPAPTIAPAPAVESSYADDSDVKVEDKPSNKFFVGGFGGVGEYPGANYIRGDFGAGVTLGMAFPDRLILEGGFTYSKYDVDYSSLFSGYPAFANPSLMQMNQYDYSVALKYQLLETRIRPVVGVVLDYAHRSYQQSYYGQTYNSNNLATSNAFDAGLLIGADVLVSKNISLGIDWRYYFNLAYSTNNPMESLIYSGVQPIESMNYYLIGLNARFMF